MRPYAGTRGYAYREQKPSSYAQDLPAAGMLRCYAERLATVEVNNTFARMPAENVLQGWSAAVPPQFHFAVKATHPRVVDVARRIGT